MISNKKVWSILACLFLAGPIFGRMPVRDAIEDTQKSAKALNKDITMLNTKRSHLVQVRGSFVDAHDNMISRRRLYSTERQLISESGRLSERLSVASSQMEDYSVKRRVLTDLLDCVPEAEDDGGFSAAIRGDLKDVLMDLENIISSDDVKDILVSTEEQIGKDQEKLSALKNFAQEASKPFDWYDDVKQPTTRPITNGKFNDPRQTDPNRRSGGRKGKSS